MDVRAVIDRYLKLVRSGVGTPEKNEQELIRVLDALALAMHDVVVPEFDATDYPDPPKLTDRQRRDLLGKQFPGMGFYNVALPVTKKVGHPAMCIGDAIDDIIDIAGDLAGVAWRWTNTSEADALWHLEFGWNHHWGEHLRELQLYLYQRRSESGLDED